MGVKKRFKILASFLVLCMVLTLVASPALALNLKLNLLGISLDANVSLDKGVSLGVGVGDTSVDANVGLGKEGISVGADVNALGLSVDADVGLGSDGVSVGADVNGLGLSVGTDVGLGSEGLSVGADINALGLSVDADVGLDSGGLSVGAGVNGLGLSVDAEVGLGQDGVILKSKIDVLDIIGLELDNTSTLPESPEEEDLEGKKPGETSFSGRASTRVLNVGAIPGVLLDVSVGKAYSWISSDNAPYSRGRATPLEVKLLGGNLLSSLLTVESIGEGKKEGGVQLNNLPASLKLLGIDAGVLAAEAQTGKTPETARSKSTLTSLKVGTLLVSSLVNTTLIDARTNVKQEISTAKINPVDISLLGGVLQVEALQVFASASATGKESGADASFDWSVADIKINGKSVLGNLRASGKVEVPGVLKLSLGSSDINVKKDGTYASVAGSALLVEVLNVVPGSAVRVAIGEASAVSSTYTVGDDNPDPGDPGGPGGPGGPDTTKGKLEVIKELVGGGDKNLLFGFTVTREKDGKKYNGTVSVNKKAQFSDLEPGWYTITEDAPPSNYSLVGYSYPSGRFEVKANDTATVTVINRFRSDPSAPVGGFKVKKVLIGDDGADSSRAFGFTVTRENGGDTFSGTVSANTEAEFKNLEPGWYTISENTPPKNYTLVGYNYPNGRFEVKANDSVTVTITNRYSKDGGGGNGGGDGVDGGTTVDPENPGAESEESVDLSPEDPMVGTNAADFLMFGLGVAMISGGWVMRRKMKKK